MVLTHPQKYANVGLVRWSEKCNFVLSPLLSYGVGTVFAASPVLVVRPLRSKGQAGDRVCGLTCPFVLVLWSQKGNFVFSPLLLYGVGTVFVASPVIEVRPLRSKGQAGYRICGLVCPFGLVLWSQKGNFVFSPLLLYGVGTEFAASLVLVIRPLRSKAQVGDRICGLTCPLGLVLWSQKGNFVCSPLLLYGVGTVFAASPILVVRPLRSKEQAGDRICCLTCPSGLVLWSQKGNFVFSPLLLYVVWGLNLRLHLSWFGPRGQKDWWGTEFVVSPVLLDWSFGAKRTTLSPVLLDWSFGAKRTTLCLHLFFCMVWGLKLRLHLSFGFAFWICVLGHVALKTCICVIR